MLEIQSLNKDFNRVSVLQNLSWQIETGTIVGLIGPNGAGKSTLLRCLAGVYTYPSGQILLDHKPIDQVKDRLFFISDEPFYFSHFNCQEMTRFYRSFYPRFDLDYYQKLLALFRFDERKPIQSLSKGLKRQSAIILALSCRPQLLLMDESFDGLDPRTRLLLKRELIDLVSEKTLSIIISSHNIRELEDIADQLALLEGGKIAFVQKTGLGESTYHKVQLGYQQPIPPELYKDMDLLHVEINGKVATIIYQENEATQEALLATKPLLVNPLPINMEEIFVYEMEARDER